MKVGGEGGVGGRRGGGERERESDERTVVVGERVWEI